MIEQALYGSRDADGYRFLGRSHGFRDEWLPAAERLCTAFGERPAGVLCLAAVFAQRLGPRHVAVVQVADQGRDDSGRPGALGFRLLVLPRSLYTSLGGDPFLIADAYPAQWDARDALPALEWTAEPPPQPKIADLRRVLDDPAGSTLLGAVQALIDGRKLLFRRPAPAAGLIRGLWSLLPVNVRCELWPSTFTFGDPVGFDVAVAPPSEVADVPGFLRGDEAADYPEGNYELALQTAVEHEDQAELDALLARRSRKQVLRLAAGLLAAFIAVPFIVSAFGRSPPPPPPPTAVPTLPAVDVCPTLDAPERAALAERIRGLAERYQSAVPATANEADLKTALAALDARLPAVPPARDPGPLGRFGPLQRQIRALLWKHSVADYEAPGLNTAELLDKLAVKLKGAP